MITVTKAFIPESGKLQVRLSQVWNSGHLTNNGPQLNELESRLSSYLNVSGLQIVSNGTIAIQIAMRALGIENGGKVLTTPYSYVATTNSILWENCVPVFVDINTTDFNVDVDLIEKYIDKDVKGMLFTHVYGFPCDVERIEQISKKYNLPVIYDAAHAFGVKLQGKSILNFGAMSTLSFHATKIFHMVEGGAIITSDLSKMEQLFLLKSFGHRGENYHQLGINGKNSEVHSAVGHCVLDSIDEILKVRKKQWEFYHESFIEEGTVYSLTVSPDVSYNYSYFPLVFTSEEIVLKVIKEMNNENIFPRRYFYPSLNELSFVNGNSCPISEDISRRVLCLPLYHDLNREDQIRIVNLIKTNL
ncbi:MAG: DegT/DnrJ/EryC1/StrS family aminotransferase [Flavobacteriales bacterium]|nr:DegT/DnrJ/EryC1/StrS family aminotransferase [Flavobacteriales bacterium]